MESVLKVAPRHVRTNNTMRRRAALLPQEVGIRSPYWGHRLLSLRPTMLGKEMRERENTTKLSCHVHVAFFPNEHLLGWHKPLALFQSSDKINSDCFCLICQCFWRDLELMTPSFSLTSGLWMGDSYFPQLKTKTLPLPHYSTNI